MIRKSKFTPAIIKAMVEEYHTGSLGRDLAVAFECSLPTVYKFLAVGGAKMREGHLSEYPAEDRAKIAAAYKKGATVRELAKEWKCSTPTIIRFIEEAGVKMRPRGRVKGWSPKKTKATKARPKQVKKIVKTKKPAKKAKAAARRPSKPAKRSKVSKKKSKSKRRAKKA